MALKRCVDNEGLLFALNHSSSNVSLTLTSFSAYTVSNIDLFILTDFIFHCVKSHATYDDFDNQSDHLPVYLTIDIKVQNVNTIVNPHINGRPPRQQWGRATITERTQYKQYLDKLFLLIEIPNDCIKCTDYFYTYYSHIVSI